jgi:hypothetical protein
LRRFLAIVITLGSDLAVAYPENIRHGYPACSACHVAPAGGGITTAYGRDAAESLMSTWSYPGEGNPLGFVPLPGWVNLGADMRSVAMKLKTSEGQESEDAFIMQMEGEIALMPVDKVTFATSTGLYGRERTEESRSAYMKLEPYPGTSLRLGRFLPAYGILFADHTVATRQGLGLGEGRETFNLEAAVTLANGELIVTTVQGREAAISSSERGYEVAPLDESGLMGRLAVFLGTRAQLGVSALSLASTAGVRTAFGVHALWGLSERVYGLLEADRSFEQGQAADLAAMKLGWEVFRGGHLALLGEWANEVPTAGLEVGFLPRPHLEVTAHWKRRGDADRYVDALVFVSHYYL